MLSVCSNVLPGVLYSEHQHSQTDVGVDRLEIEFLALNTGTAWRWETIL